MLDDMILELDAEIADSFPDVAELDDKLEALQAELGQLERELAFARDSAQAGLVQKKRLIEAISGDQQRANDVSVTLESFAQLMQVYESDVARLEAIEEAGDRKSTRLNSKSLMRISYAVFCLKKKT